MDGYLVNGRKLRTLRERHGHRQAPFARLAGISRSYLKDVEGPVNNPDAPNLQPSAVVVYRIASALGVDITEFCEPTDDTKAGAA